MGATLPAGTDVLVVGAGPGGATAAYHLAAAGLEGLLGDGADPHASQVLARFVVAADGAAARFAGGAGVRRDAAGPVAVAARRYYRSPARHEPMFETFLALEDRGRLLPGYGWIFPMGDG